MHMYVVFEIYQEASSLKHFFNMIDTLGAAVKKIPGCCIFP